jgi:hypothetical protein
MFGFSQKKLIGIAIVAAVVAAVVVYASNNVDAVEDYIG